MITIMVFNIPEDQPLFDAANKGAAWRSVVVELENSLRNKIKHGHSYKTPTEALEGIRDELWEELNAEGIDPHKE